MSFSEMWTIFRPQWTVGTYRCIIILSVIIFVFCRKVRCICRWTNCQSAIAWMLGSYLIIVFVSTVFAREPLPEPQYKLELFWSYTQGMAVRSVGFKYSVGINILMLMPIGLFMPVIIGKDLKKKSVYAKITFFTGFCITILIELLQLIFKRGLFEFDDIFHNMLGIIIGFLVYCCVSKIRTMFYRRNQK